VVARRHFDVRPNWRSQKHLLPHSVAATFKNSKMTRTNEQCAIDCLFGRKTHNEI